MQAFDPLHPVPASRASVADRLVCLGVLGQHGAADSRLDHLHDTRSFPDSRGLLLSTNTTLYDLLTCSRVQALSHSLMTCGASDFWGYGFHSDGTPVPPPNNVVGVTLQHLLFGCCPSRDLEVTPPVLGDDAPRSTKRKYVDALF
jgi:hypothetical protein